MEGGRFELNGCAQLIGIYIAIHGTEIDLRLHVLHDRAFLRVLPNLLEEIQRGGLLFDLEVFDLLLEVAAQFRNTYA